MCLNPYCAGIWSRRTLNKEGTKVLGNVLILIVLEYGLGVQIEGDTEVPTNVLILIVLEYGLGGLTL